jgi:hypothetical protein
MIDLATSLSLFWVEYTLIGVASTVLLLSKIRFVLRSLQIEERDHMRWCWFAFDRDSPDLTPTEARVFFAMAIIICVAT